MISHIILACRHRRVEEPVRVIPTKDRFLAITYADKQILDTLSRVPEIDLVVGGGKKEKLRH